MYSASTRRRCCFLPGFPSNQDGKVRRSGDVVRALKLQVNETLAHPFWVQWIYYASHLLSDAQYYITQELYRHSTV